MTMKRRLHPFAILGTTVLGFALVGVGLYKYTEAQSALTVEAELEKLRAMGVPTTYAEFAEFAPKPGSDNSASLYERAIDEIVAIGLPTRPSIMTSWKIDPAKRKAYLVKTQSAHDALVLATKGGDCVFERDWRLGFRLAFPEYRALTALAEMVSIRAELASESQDWDQMFGELSVMKRMATQVREPTLLSILMTTSYEARWLRPIELALNSYFDDPRFLASARRALDEPQKPIDLRSAFCAEVASLRDAVNFAVTPSSGTSSFRGRYDEWALRHPKSRHVIYATALRELRMILDGSMEDPFEVARRARESDARINQDTSPTGMAVQSALPVGFWKTLSRSPTRHRLLLVALWAAERRLETGQFPTALPNDQRFFDPWTGKPYLLIRPEQGLIIRSVGANGLDDGGPTSPTGRTDDVDVSIGVPVPAR